MKFRPCIDIHDGKVKQIVGSSLRDADAAAHENFVAEEGAAYFARLFAKDRLDGGHVIVLNGKDTPGYEASVLQAKEALLTYPGGFSFGGGVTAENAADYLKAGAYAVIATSYLFEDGAFSMARLARLEEAVGAEHIIIDLSCKPFDGSYHVMCDRWQTKTEAVLDATFLEMLAPHCLEFLVHGIAVEGKGQGIDEDLVRLLASFHDLTITYAGGIRHQKDIETMKELGRQAIDFTVGTALDLYGGPLAYTDLLAYSS